MKRFWKLLTQIVIVTWLIFLCVLLFWQVYPYKVSDVKVPIKILNKNKQIAVGEAIQMELELTKPNNTRPVGSVYITCDSGNLITLNGSPQNLPVGQYKIINERYLLPDKILSGDKCVFIFKNSYRVNPIREITKTWTSERFTVKE